REERPARRRAGPIARRREALAAASLPRSQAVPRRAKDTPRTCARRALRRRRREGKGTPVRRDRAAARREQTRRALPRAAAPLREGADRAWARGAGWPSGRTERPAPPPSGSGVRSRRTRGLRPERRTRRP